jgi:glutamate dehydrogenase (NAD(P)+)
MHGHGILNIPDFIANAGGVICAAVEVHGGAQSQAWATIQEKIRANCSELLEIVRREGVLPRAAALQMARRRLQEAMRYRRV